MYEAAETIATLHDDRCAPVQVSTDVRTPSDLVFNDHTLHAGDYEVDAPDTAHSPVTTHGGCLLLIIHNAGDQLLA